MKSGNWRLVVGAVVAVAGFALLAGADRRESDTSGVIDARVQRQAMLAEMQQMNVNLREMNQLLKDIRTRLPEPEKKEGRGGR